MGNTFKNSYGEWAVVTGANSGIGRALAFEIAEKGLNIVLVARRTPELEEVSNKIKEKYKVSTMVISADLTEQNGINDVIGKTDGLNIGMLVLSAGIENNGSFIKNDLETELKVIQLNIVSTIKLTFHFAKKMESFKKGGIMLVASLTAHMPSPYFSNYAATKSYVLNFGSSLYAELKPKGIDISVLSPGVTNTAMSENTGIDWTKSKVQIMSPEEVAKEAINHFGKKLSIIPGTGNRLIAFIAKKIISTQKLATTNQRMMQKILNPSKL